MTKTLAERAALTQSTFDRFRGKPFDWAGANCIRMARVHGVAMGHSLPPVPQFRSVLGARKALAKRGFDTVTAMLDSYFAALPAPAYALVGDLVSMPVDPDHEGLEAIAIADGLGNLFAWHGSTDFRQPEVIKFAMADALKAWRL